MKYPLVPPIAVDLLFDRLEIRKQVPMCEDNAARFGCRPRSEHNFHWIGPLRRHRGEAYGQAAARGFPLSSNCANFAKLFEANGDGGEARVWEAAPHNSKPHTSLLRDA